MPGPVPEPVPLGTNMSSERPRFMPFCKPIPCHRTEGIALSPPKESVGILNALILVVNTSADSRLGASKALCRPENDLSGRTTETV